MLVRELEVNMWDEHEKQYMADSWDSIPVVVLPGLYCFSCSSHMLTSNSLTNMAFLLPSPKVTTNTPKSQYMADSWDSIPVVVLPGRGTKRLNGPWMRWKFYTALIFMRSRQCPIHLCFSRGRYLRATHKGVGRIVVIYPQTIRVIGGCCCIEFPTHPRTWIGHCRLRINMRASKTILNLTRISRRGNR
jgi:hypothetical protein